MNEFKIPCKWEVYGWATVEANSIEEAMEVVNTCGDFPEFGEPIEGSLKIYDILDDEMFELHRKMIEVLEKRHSKEQQYGQSQR